MKLREILKNVIGMETEKIKERFSKSFIIPNELMLVGINQKNDLSIMMVSTNVKTKSHEQIFSEIFPKISNQLKHETYMVVWCKLIKKEIKKEDGTKDFIKGFMIVFESVYGTIIKCFELNLLGKFVDENGNVVQRAEFGNDLQLESTYEYENRFNDLLTKEPLNENNFKIPGVIE